MLAATLDDELDIKYYDEEDDEDWYMDDKKIKELELKIVLLMTEMKSLREQVSLLKRENNRSKSNITQIANHLNRKQ